MFSTESYLLSEVTSARSLAANGNLAACRHHCSRARKGVTPLSGTLASAVPYVGSSRKAVNLVAPYRTLRQIAFQHRFQGNSSLLSFLEPRGGRPSALVTIIAFAFLAIISWTRPRAPCFWRRYSIACSRLTLVTSVPQAGLGEAGVRAERSHGSVRSTLVLAGTAYDSGCWTAVSGKGGPREPWIWRLSRVSLLEHF